MANTLPSNVVDPRFAQRDDDASADWDEPDPMFYWHVLEALLDALPRVVEHVLHR